MSKKPILTQCCTCARLLPCTKDKLGAPRCAEHSPWPRKKRSSSPIKVDLCDSNCGRSAAIFLGRDRLCWECANDRIEAEYDQMFQPDVYLHNSVSCDCGCDHIHSCEKSGFYGIE